jgi:hypothetical protein
VRDALHAQASGTPPAPVGQAAIGALSKNPLFAANWVRHMVRTALAESETTAFSYDGLLFAGPTAVKEVLPGKWEVVGIGVPAAEAAKDSAPVALRLPDGGQIRLPRGRDVHEANLVHAPELEDLLAAKNLLLDALMDYRLTDRVPADIGRVLAHLAVLRPLHVT